MHSVIRSVRRAALAVSLLPSALAGCAVTGGERSSPTAAARAAAKPVAPVFTREDVMARSAREIDALFGAPALVRREGPGEYRRYALARCGLIVIFYPDATGAPAAAHIDASAKTAPEPKPDLDACLAAGLPEGAAPAAGPAGAVSVKPGV